MINDPVCGMELDMRRAGAMAVHKGRSWYFCSDNCKQKFIAKPEIYLGNARAERLTVGVMGSADSDSDQAVSNRARILGETIANDGLILITGACPGLPYECASGARARGGLSVGISPALSLDEHLHKYHSPADAFDILIYTGSGLMGREVTNILSSDMVIILGGRSGTLGEFAIAYDEGKLIGVLKGSGGITDELPDLVRRIGKDTGALLVYESDPKVLIEEMLKIYSERHYRRPSCFCIEPLSEGKSVC
ncbi:YHS domain-containing protein [Sedimenticola selenatireducens]|jgi:hypothetical protein|uniref:YHS domain-containing protein n=1 Tax=Sedimenticola selenatireducens TaxID=191960 RepID=A0A558DQB9_9GAMM|nr:YHS domain-containing protein [Sedimenticola selenatireducens]TVO73009.1 YHS domain-containing protein [Sedimenticola selenatireducens]TVT63231.1 MAG: YHS domain-containing protein [Sedimenticola selenatireducens]